MRAASAQVRSFFRFCLSFMAALLSSEAASSSWWRGEMARGLPAGVGGLAGSLRCWLRGLSADQRAARRACVRASVRACEGPCAGLRAAAGQASVECNDGGVKGQRLRRNAHI